MDIKKDTVVLQDSFPTDKDDFNKDDLHCMVKNWFKEEESKEVMNFIVEKCLKNWRKQHNHILVMLLNMITVKQKIMV